MAADNIYSSEIGKAVRYLDPEAQPAGVSAAKLLTGANGKFIYEEVRYHGKKHRSNVDQACRHFLEKGKWPTVDDVTQLLILARILAAHKECVSQLKLQCEVKQQDASSSGEFVRWLLLDHWHESASEIWPSYWLLELGRKPSQG